MVRLEDTRRYRVPRDSAFNYITDPHNWPEYWPGLVAVTDPQARWQHPGDTMRLQMKLAGRPTELHMTLDRIQVPSLVTYHTVQHGLPDAQHERHFDPADDGFVYRLVITYRPRPGVTGLLDRTFVKWAIRRVMRQTLDNLDRRLAPRRDT